MDAATLAAAKAQMFPRVLPPSTFPAFTKLPTPKVYRIGGGRFRGVLNFASLKPSGGNTYYLDRAGSAGNTGLTPGSPWPVSTVVAAVNAGSGGDTVYVLSGEIQSTAWAPLTKSANWLAYTPGARITGWSSPGLTWTLVTGSAGTSGAVYSTPKLSTNGVYDLLNLTAWGDYTAYVGKGTGLADQATALAAITADGQWATDGTSVYVRPTGGMDLTNTTTRNNVRLRQNSTQGISTTGTGIVQYVRGIAFEGCSSGVFGALGNAIIIGEDCSFKYAAGNGTRTDGGHMITVRCTASSNDSDGLNYHDNAGNHTEFIEIDCTSHHNGLQKTDDVNNGSTCHDTCRGIRVGGSYYANTGPTLADVTAAKTWNLGCSAYGSIAIASTQRCDFFTDTTAEQWLDECSSNGANLTGGTGTGYTFKPNGATAKIHLNGHRGAAFPVAIEPAGGGVVDYYAPNA